MPRGMPRTASDRIRKWRAKVTPEYWAFTIQATKDMALEKVAQYQLDYQHVYSNVKAVLDRYPSEAFRTQEYMWYALKLYHCVRVYKGNALTKCGNAVFMYFAVLGLNVDAMTEIAGSLGVKIDPIEKIIGGLGIVAAKPLAVNVTDGPNPVTSMEPAVVARILVEHLAYIEGVEMVADNPSGSAVTLWLRVYAVHSKGRTEIMPQTAVAEGTVLRDWIRWLYDEIPDGAEVQGVEAEAWLDSTPATGLEPTVTIRLTGVRLAPP